MIHFVRFFSGSLRLKMSNFDEIARLHTSKVSKLKYSILMMEIWKKKLYTNRISCSHNRPKKCENNFACYRQLIALYFTITLTYIDFQRLFFSFFLSFHNFLSWQQKTVYFSHSHSKLILWFGNEDENVFFFIL